MQQKYEAPRLVTRPPKHRARLETVSPGKRPLRASIGLRRDAMLPSPAAAVRFCSCTPYRAHVVSVSIFLSNPSSVIVHAIMISTYAVILHRQLPQRHDSRFKQSAGGKGLRGK